MSLVYKDFNEVNVINTVTTTDLFVFDFAEYQSFNNYKNEYWGPGGSMRVTLAGGAGQNVGAGTPNAAWELFLGSNSIAGLNADIPAGFPYWKLIYTVYTNGPTHSQHLIRELFVGDTGANSGDERLCTASDPISIDLLSSPVLTAKVTLSTASVNFNIRKNFASIEYI